MQRKSVVNLLSVLLCLGAVAIGAFLFGNKYYYPVSVLILVFGSIPFCALFRHRHVKVRELSLVATMTAICVASRAAFYMIPFVKPMCAIAVIAGLSFGAETGFVVGALSMFLSNFIFGQGAWTPFQVFGMGLTAFLAAAILRICKQKQNRLICAIVGGVLCMVVYGIIVDTGSFLLMTTERTWKAAVSIYAAGVPFNAIHAGTTAVVLYALAVPMAEKLERIRIKYALFGE